MWPNRIWSHLLKKSLMENYLRLHSDSINYSEAFSVFWYKTGFPRTSEQRIQKNVAKYQILPSLVSLAIYKPFIRPHLDYGDIIYDPKYNTKFHQN